MQERLSIQELHGIDYPNYVVLDYDDSIGSRFHTFETRRLHGTSTLGRKLRLGDDIIVSATKRILKEARMINVAFFLASWGSGRPHHSSSAKWSCYSIKD